MQVHVWDELNINRQERMCMLMAAKYVERFGGYIVDVPYFYFKRAGDKKVFVNKHVTQCSLNPQTDFIEVRSGWSSYASANIPGQSTMDVQITLGDFMPELFAMSNTADVNSDATFKVPVTERLAISQDKTVELTYAPVADSVYINGLTKSADQTTEEGQFYVVGKVVHLHQDETGKKGEIEVFYETVDQSEDASVININNRDTACGEVILKWPIYNDAKDCSDSGIIKYAIVRIFKARVTTQPGFDTSLASCRLLAA